MTSAPPCRPIWNATLKLTVCLQPTLFFFLAGSRMANCFLDKKKTEILTKANLCTRLICRQTWKEEKKREKENEKTGWWISHVQHESERLRARAYRQKNRDEQQVKNQDRAREERQNYSDQKQVKEQDREREKILNYNGQLREEQIDKARGSYSLIDGTS